MARTKKAAAGVADYELNPPGYNRDNAIANFAALYGITVGQVKKLIRAADLVNDRGVQWSNVGDSVLASYEQAQTDFEVLVKRYGFDGYELNGLYPTLHKDGQDVWLPE